MKKSPRPEQGRFVYFRRAWRSLPLARKAVLAVVLPILALLAGFVLLYVFAEAEQRAHHGLGASVRTRNYLNIIYRGVLSEEASVHGFALTRDQALLLPFDSARHTAAAAFQELAPLLADDPAQASRVVAFRGAVEQRFAVLEQLRDAAQEADPGAGATLAPLITSGHEWAAAMRVALDQIEAREFQKRDQHLGHVHTARTRTLTGYALVVLLGGLGGFGGVWLLTKSIVRRVHLIGENADLLARELPLTYFASGKDEISQLARRLQYTSGLLTSRTAALRDEAQRLEAEIAERTKVEKSLRETEARLQAILDHTSAVVYVKDLAGRFQLVNRQFETLFKISRVETRGKTVSELFGGEIGEPLQQHDEEVIRRAIPLEFEETVPLGGSDRVYLSMKFPLLDQTGQPYAICGISTDITARKAAEQSLRARVDENDLRVKERTTELEQKPPSAPGGGAAPGDCATPRAFAAALSPRAKDRGDRPARRRGGAPLQQFPHRHHRLRHHDAHARAGGRARAESSRANPARRRPRGRANKQLLAFSRRLPSQPVPLNLSVLVRDFQKTLRQVIGDRVTLSTDLPRELPSARADAGQIEQLLLNLVANACEAVSRAGAITISTRAVSMPDPDANNGSIVLRDYVASPSATTARACHPG